MVQAVFSRNVSSNISLRYEFHLLQAKTMVKAYSFPAQITVHYTALGMKT